MLERDYQRRVKQKIREKLGDDCIILKIEGKQGFPDLLILKNDSWAVLECKRSKNAAKRPNQDFFVKKANEMSYGSFIYPENERTVLNELKQKFGITT